jgi:NAD(P)-dependent dehydrogenase (short-subunit alcohol dehydrogenase family)
MAIALVTGASRGIGKATALPQEVAAQDASTACVPDYQAGSLAAGSRRRLPVPSPGYERQSLLCDRFAPRWQAANKMCEPDGGRLIRATTTSLEVAAQGIRVNGVRPGFIYAGMRRAASGRVDRVKQGAADAASGQPGRSHRLSPGC